MSEVKETVKELLAQYANDCLSDRILSCKTHKNACKRFLRDLKRAETDPSFPYYWDEREAEDIVVWFTLFKHKIGVLAGQPIHLIPAQQFDICQLYGWRKKENGRRRFRKFYLQEGRKNAKSQVMAAIALHEIAISSMKMGEILEVYTAGPKRQQSRVIFEACLEMLQDSDVKDRFKTSKIEIRHIKSGSFIRALSKEDGKTGDGTSIHMLCLDERHQMPTNEFAALFHGAASSDPLMVSITTSGVDLSYPCYQEYLYTKRILDENSDIDDPEYLVDIFELDPEDYVDVRNVADERLWIKANPVRATFEKGLNDIRKDYTEALAKPGDLPMALTKLFDIWVQAKESGYMDMEKWKACEVQELPVDIRGLRCVIGVDLSSKIDLSAVCFVIPFQDENDLDAEGEPITKYIVKQHSFIPNRQKLLERIASDKVPYDAWELQGFLSVTNTSLMDHQYVRRWAIEYAESQGLVIDSWAVDPFNATEFMLRLSDGDENGKNRYTVYDVAQNYGSLSDATVGFREEVFAGHVYYLPDALYNFTMGNAVVRSNDGRIKIDKDIGRQRIDPVDATINGFKLARLIKQDSKIKQQRSEFLDDYIRMLEEEF